MTLRSLGLALVLSALAIAAAPMVSAEGSQPPIAAPSSLSLDRLPLAFEANRGQTDARARFVARAPDMTLFLTETGALLSLVSAKPESSSAQALALRLHFANAHPQPRIEGEDPLPGRSHYLIGNDPKRWHTEIAQYRRVRYRDVYPGVDVVYYGREGKLEFDLEVAPGADLTAVRLRVDGADRLVQEANGDLRLDTPLGALVQHRPIVYQIVDGQRRELPGDYVLREAASAGAQEVTFRIADYDRRLALVIDPTLVAAFLTGGTMSDIGKAVAADAAGNWYFAGDTSFSAAGFPTTLGAFQIVHGGSTDIFVRKVSSDASTVLYSTLIGGNNLDVAEGIDVDGAGNAYVGGWTTSSNYPVTAGAMQLTKPGGAADFAGVVTALNAAGSALIYSTHLGGNTPSFMGGIPSTQVFDIAVDENGMAYVTGETAAADLPTNPEAFKTSLIDGPHNAFVFKFDPTGARQFGTYLGDSGFFSEDRGREIAVDEAHNVYVLGRTHASFSTDYNNVAAAQIGPGGGEEILLARLNHTGSWLDWVTHIGGTALDHGSALAVDQGHQVMLAARSLSEDLAPNTTHADTWTWLARVDASGTQLLDSTWLGAAGANVFPNDLAWEDGVVLVGDVQNPSALTAIDPITTADCTAACGTASTFGGVIALYDDEPLTQQSLTRVVGGANTRFNAVAEATDSATERTAVSGSSADTPLGTSRPPGDLSGNNAFGVIFDQDTLPLLPPEVTKHFEPPSVGPNHRTKLVFVIRNPNLVGDITGIEVSDLFPACLVDAFVIESSQGSCPERFDLGANQFGLSVIQLFSIGPGQVCTVEFGIEAGNEVADCLNTTEPIVSDQGTLAPASATLKIANNPVTAVTTGACASMNMSDAACWNGNAVPGNTSDARILPCPGGTCTINYDRPPSEKLGQITFEANTNVTGTNPMLAGDGIAATNGATVNIESPLLTPATSLDLETTLGASINFAALATLSDGSYVDISGEGTVDFEAGLGGGGSLIIESGTVTTSADILIDGDIDVVGGTLIANDLVEPDVFVSGNGRVEGSGPFSAMKLTATGTFSSGQELDVTSMASFDVEDVATVEIDFGAGNATFGPIDSTGPITLEENSMLKLNLAETAAPGTVFSDLITSSGGLITGCFAAGATNQPQLGATVQCTASSVSATIASVRIFFSGFEN